MPSTATITAFYTFSPSTKAKASEVNNNFSMFRGHLIPIEPNTVTSSNLVYDLGSTEHRWNNGYINKVNLGQTSTSWSIEDSTTTSDYLSIKQNGSIKFAISKNVAETTTAGINQISKSSLISDFPSGSTTVSFSINVSGSTCTINSIGRPILIQLNPANTSSGSFVQATRSLGTGSQYGGNVSLYRNGSTLVTSWRYLFTHPTSTAFGNFQTPCSAISAIDLAPQGANTYHLQLSPDANCSLRVVYSYLTLFEL